MPENLIPSVQSLHQYLADNPDHELLIRTCDIMDIDGPLISRGLFQWPNTLGAVVHAPDWDPVPECGKGLHALRAGQQDPGVWYQDGAWLLVAADKNSIVPLEDNSKSKAPSFTILAIAYTNGSTLIPQLLEQLGWSKPIYNATIVDETYNSFVTVGNFGHAKAKDWAVAGKGGHATTDNFGTSIAGYNGTATAGDCGRAIVGNDGRAIVGNVGLAIAGTYGAVSAGNKGCIAAEYFTKTSSRRYLHVGYIGETLDIDGQILLPNQFYYVSLKTGIPQWAKV